MLIVLLLPAAAAPPPHCDPWPHCRDAGQEDPSEPPVSLEFSTFSDASFSHALRTFNVEDAVYLRALVGTESGACTDCDVTVTLSDGTFTDQVTLSHDGNGQYSGSWHGAPSTNAVVGATVTASNDAGSIQETEQFHSYEAGVSTYELDVDGDGRTEHVLENTLLRAAFSHSGLVDLTEKTSGQSFSFSGSQATLSADSGAFSPTDITSSDGTVSFTYEASGNDADKEIVLATAQDIWIMEWDDATEQYVVEESFATGSTDWIGQLRVGDVEDVHSGNEIVLTRSTETGQTEIYSVEGRAIDHFVTFDSPMTERSLAVGQAVPGGSSEIAVDSLSGSGVNGVTAMLYGFDGSAFINIHNFSKDSSMNYAIFIEDIDGDGLEETGLQNRFHDTIPYAYELWEAGSFTADGVIDAGDFIHDAVAFGDADGDGIQDAFFVGSSGELVVIRGGSHEVLFRDIVVDSQSQAVALGDFDDDGCIDVAVGDGSSSNDESLNILEGDCSGDFVPTAFLDADGYEVIWEIDTLRAADMDGDGRDEIYGFMYNFDAGEAQLHVWKHDGSGYGYWGSESLGSYASNPRTGIVIADIDEPSVGGVSGVATANYTLVTAEADFLRVDVWASDLSNTSSLGIDMQGAIGASADDRLHTSSGYDALVSAVSTDWNATIDQYVAVYDDSQDLVLSLVRLPSIVSANMAFHGGSAAGLSSSFDVLGTSSTETLSTLLVFTAGDFTVIDHWMDDISRGTLPSPNFRSVADPEPTDPVCGNGVVESGEECDGSDHTGQTCTSLGFDSGTLACSSSCTFDTSSCQYDPVCGNGVVEDGEECDGTDFGGLSCSDLGFDSGSLSCTESCTVDSSACESETACMVTKHCDCDGSCHSREQGRCGDCA